MFQAMRRIVSSLGNEKVTECTFDRAIRNSFLGMHISYFPFQLVMRMHMYVVSGILASHSLSMSSCGCSVCRHGSWCAPELCRQA